MQTNTRSENVITIASHPDFMRWVKNWQTLNDTVDGGATEVRRKTTVYLPATSGQVTAWNESMNGLSREYLSDTQWIDHSKPCGCDGQGAYAYYLYQFRAVFYEYPAETVRQMVGRLTSAPAEIELPAELEPMVDKATSTNLSMQALIGIIEGEQCKYSRCGVLADFPAKPTTEPPYLSVYGALRVVNWCTDVDDDGKEVLKWVLLDESKYVQDGINSSYANIIRVCALDDAGDYFTKTVDVTAYMTGNSKIPSDVANDILKPDEDSIYPMYKGNKSKAIPFVFINATNTSATPELPILDSVSDKSLAIYRGEADYRQALFMQGQETPWFAGIAPEEAKTFLLGANGCVASGNKDFKAGFMGVEGKGLSEMKDAQEALHNLVIAEGSKLLNAGANESGDALKERNDSATISLTTIAQTCQDGLVKLMQIVTDWGKVSGEITISTNKDFASASMDWTQSLSAIKAYNAGLPVTKEDIHKSMVEGGLIDSEWKEVEQELDMTGRNDNLGDDNTSDSED